jgi:thiol-disulfide isomerase/thioredoxin
MKSMFWMVLMSAFLLTLGPVDVQATDEVAEDAVKPYSFPEKATSRVIQAEEAGTITKLHGSDLLVVNYWATWCGPCVEELPYFIRLARELPQTNVRFVGYSLDFVEDAETLVDPFLKEKGVPYSNFILQVEPNEFIPTVSTNWSGQLPATFFYDRNGKLLAEILTPVKYEELSEKVDELLEKLGLEVERRSLDDEPNSSD